LADLTRLQADLPVNLAGVNQSTGASTFFVSVDSDGGLLVAGEGTAGTPTGGVLSIQGVTGGTAVPVSQSTTPWITQDLADGSVTGGTAGTYSQLTGGQYNSTLPTLTTGQQSAIQVDSHGRILTVSSNFPLAVDTNYGTVGANTLRTASQIGNATGAANFGAGATGAQTLRVAANTYDGSGNAINSQTLSSNQWLDVVIPSIGPVSPGTVASFSDLVGGQYNSTQPTLTNTQQSALQLDALGNLRATLPDRQVTGTLGALNATITLSNLNGMSSGALELDGSFSGTVLVEGASGSTQYCTIALYDISLGYMTAINFTGATVQGNYQLIGVGSYTTIKATVSAYTSGSLTATLTLSSGIDLLNVVSPYAPNFNAQVVGNVASGTADSGNGVKVSGIYNSSAPTFVSGNRADLQTDVNGNLKITGTVTSTNTSIGQVNTTPPSFATYIGAYASTSPPTWGNGDLAPLSVENVGGYLRTADSSDGPVTAGTAATTSMLAGGQYNTTLPTLTTGQQAAIQLDSSGRLIIRPLTSADVVSAVQSGTWTTGRTWTLASGTDSVSAVQSGTWNINNISGTISLPTGAATSALQTTGNTSLATIVTNTNSLILAQGSTTSGQTGNLAMGAVTTAAPTYVTGQTDPFSLNTSGGLRIAGITGAIDASSAQNILTPASGIAILGEFNTTPTTIVSGNSSPLQLDNAANLLVNLKTAIPAGANAIGSITNTSFDATQATASSLNAQVVGNVAVGSPVSGNPVQIGGSDGTDVREVALNLKGTQGAYAVATQDLKDAGRNLTTFYMPTQIISTATDTLVSLSGYKSGAAVAGTTTPAVVSAGKILRINMIIMTYIAVTTGGTIHFTLRANTGGTVVIGSPEVFEYALGSPANTAGVSQTVVMPIPDGLEFAAGTGIGVSMQGFGATGTAAAVGYGMIAIKGYEY
jgi:hypothetical protein